MLQLNDQNLTFYPMDPRAYSLSQHPHNFGYFKYHSSPNLVDPNLIKLNLWVDKQRLFCQELPLEIKAGLLLYQRYPQAFETDLDPLDLMNYATNDIRELFETLPSKEQISRFRCQIYQTLLRAPKLPVSLCLVSPPTNSNLLLVNLAPTNSPDLSNVYPGRVLDENTSMLYLDAIFEIKHHLLLAQNNIDLCEKKEVMEDDVYFYVNARKETLEETGVDIGTLKSRQYIDFPLYLQTEYSSNDPMQANVLIPKVHGIVASGTLFICREDQTILLFQRSYRGDFGGTWAGSGGAIGEDKTIVYKTKFKFRTFIYEITAMQKKLWQGLDLPRINYEHTQFEWIDYNTLSNQTKKWIQPDKLPVNEKVSKFLRTYESQIPTILHNLDSLSLEQQEKFGLYLYNQKSRLYELIHPGTAYTLWHLFTTNL